MVSNTEPADRSRQEGSVPKEKQSELVRPPLEFVRVEVYVGRASNGFGSCHNVVAKIVSEIRQAVEEAVECSRTEGSRV
ncbi:hypothetical protein COY93_01035 [Candidatus Uhrbacteria bacterium CG_4_10_14_0_8_um_filter_58_22]|uniref:Uncharacterized protein n=1 Tax=Candidatus Uhrbacteria bacterium CG_4_10_14_0_8_um_filter_58_22 TaxID=1975029 RepID=A0A2M7QBU8_9BACT|nr:MAG: hypothetical protein AUJ19_03645 [Parcubacteria group bacterium CG1_02_58_44]PIY63251.1 MAG: hypothetical protein COY93_01035 [Candidatus Uhrbacteria bacterium CG_4_10_14_0_8_um_filter_58_22]